ncbi:carbonic anhydrase [Flagelloscypha sp. PMI_526]|nr:carbonic anhydrase [Flagelloscypha sp. PMI_526]
MSNNPNHVHFTEWNKPHVETYGEKAKLGINAVKGLAVLTCQDTRVNPQSIFGLADGDAHWIRNGGGIVTEDVLRTLVIAQRFGGVHEIVVVRHTDCGGTHFNKEIMYNKFAAESPAGLELVKKMEFDGFGELGVEGGVRKDVKTLKESPLFLEDTIITGWVYEVETGKIVQVA